MFKKTSASVNCLMDDLFEEKLYVIKVYIPLLYENSFSSLYIFSWRLLVFREHLRSHLVRHQPPLPVRDQCPLLIEGGNHLLKEDL